MAVVPRSVLDSLTNEINLYKQMSGDSVEETLLEIAEKMGINGPGPYDNKTLQRFRNVARDTLYEMTAMLSPNVVTMTADYVGGLYGKPARYNTAAVTSSAVPALAEIDEKMRAMLGDVYSGRFDVPRYITECAEYGGKLVNITHVRALDSIVGPKRWNRVPSGSETCMFCIMLCSRKDEYLSAETAAAHYHPNCDCRVVPAGLKIQGFNQDALKKQFDDYIDDEAEKLASRINAKAGKIVTTADDQRSVVLDRFSTSAKNTRSAASNKKESVERFTTTAVNGAKVRIDNLPRSRSVSYDRPPEVAAMEKSWDRLERHEKAGIWHVCNSFGDAVSVPVEDGAAASNLDLKIAGKLWEMKNVTNGESSVSNQLGRARKKWLKLGRNDGVRVVITMEGCKSSYDDVVNGITKRIKKGETVMLYDEDGIPTKITRQ